MGSPHHWWRHNWDLLQPLALWVKYTREAKANATFAIHGTTPLFTKRWQKWNAFWTWIVLYSRDKKWLAYCKGRGHMCQKSEQPATKTAEKVLWKFWNDLIFKRQIFIEVKPIHSQQSFMASRGRKMVSDATSYKNCGRALFDILQWLDFQEAIIHRGYSCSWSAAIYALGASKMASIANVGRNSTMACFVLPSQPVPLMRAWLKKRPLTKQPLQPEG